MIFESREKGGIFLKTSCLAESQNSMKRISGGVNCYVKNGTH